VARGYDGADSKELFSTHTNVFRRLVVHEQGAGRSQTEWTVCWCWSSCQDNYCS